MAVNERSVNPSVWLEVQEQFAELSPAEQRLARFVLDHTDEVPFLSTNELAERTGLSNASVTRFAQRLGYEGYPHLQREVRRHLRQRFAPRTDPGQTGLLSQFWQLEQSNFAQVVQTSEAHLEPFVSAVVKAQSVWVVGTRASKPIASVAAHYLGLHRSRVYLLDSEDKQSYEAVLDANPKDVALVYTIRRYAKATTRLGQALHAQGVPLLLITDDGPAPLAKLAHQELRLSLRGIGNLHPLGSLLSLTQAITLLAAQRLDRKRIQQRERLLEELDVYEY